MPRSRTSPSPPRSFSPPLPAGTCWKNTSLPRPASPVRLPPPGTHCRPGTYDTVPGRQCGYINLQMRAKRKKLVLSCVKTSFFFLFGGDKRDRTADLLNAIQALSRLDRLHTPLNRANRAFNTRDTPPKAAKPSAFFLKFIIAGARPHINTKFENKLDTAIPFSHGIISLFHSERGC